MKRSRFSEEQIIGILKEHQAGLSAQDLCRKHGISDATFYKWRSKYGGMDISDARRLKALEEENRKLKKLLAESDARCGHTQRDARKKLLTPRARRTAVRTSVEMRDAKSRPSFATRLTFAFCLGGVLRWKICSAPAQAATLPFQKAI